jgi:hypothetical protein
MKKIFLFTAFSFFIFIFVLSCSKVKKDIPNDKTEKEKIKSESISYPDIQPPKTGKGNVAGRILWNSKPAEGIEVTMCKDFNIFSGCKGREYKETTNADGFFVIRDAEPGEYSLVVKVFKSDKYLYFTSGIGITAKKHTVTENETEKLGEQNIYKLDLKVTAPKSESVLKNSRPTINWDAYPEAAYYKVTLRPESGDNVFYEKKIEDTSLNTDVDLADCKYNFKIEAYNSEDAKIAEANDDLKFIVSNNKGSCKINVLSPINKSNVSSKVTIKWEKHPLASGYTVYVAKSSTGKSDVIVNFVVVTETEYTIDKVLEPGEYNFSVYCKNDSDKKIAESGTIFFTVK